MTQTRHWTSADLDQFPDDGKRYEIIAGELFACDDAAEYGHPRIATADWLRVSGGRTFPSTE
jgi:hypothetical protein